MPSWVNERAHLPHLTIGQAYSKREAARAMSVSEPAGSRDWGGLVRFSNAVSIFITLEKETTRYADEHRYQDQFDQDLLYWDSRASHDRKSGQVKHLVAEAVEVVAFARISEKEAGKTRPFHYLGKLEFVSWWGSRPVHFTWRLLAFPLGLVGSEGTEALGRWRPKQGRWSGATKDEGTTGNRGPAGASPQSNRTEGAISRVLANRYERDPRARQECLAAHGTACFVCGFDFEATYGSLGLGFTFVHHRVPLAMRARDGEYDLDPKLDLVPICGNCHGIVHRRQGGEGSPPQLSAAQQVRLADLRRLALSDDWESSD